MDFEKTKSKESFTSRESRQESTLDQEINAGEWMRLCKYKAYKRRSRQGRILAVYQAISNRLDQLVKVFYELAREEKSLKAAEKMLIPDEIEEIVS